MSQTIENIDVMESDPFDDCFKRPLHGVWRRISLIISGSDFGVFQAGHKMNACNLSAQFL
jgi:hypothetical protein